MLLYLLLYAVLVIGTFGVVTAVGRTGDAATDLAGVPRSRASSKPVLALGHDRAAAGAGRCAAHQWVRRQVRRHRAAVDEHSYAIAIIAMVSAVIAAFLYLRIMISMWIAEPEAGDDAREPVRVPLLLGVAIGLSVGFTLWSIGFFPGWLIDLAP